MTRRAPLLLALLHGCLVAPGAMESIGDDAGTFVPSPTRELPPMWRTLYGDAGPAEDVPPAREPVADVPVARDAGFVTDVPVVRDAGFVTDVPVAPTDRGPATPPPTGEPCGRYAGWNVWSCIDGRTRVRCIANVLQRDTCATRCVVQPVGVDDYCAAASTYPDDACSWARTCTACAQQPSCGFCRSTGRCFRGNGYGASNGACAGADWAWDPNTCGATTPTPPTPTPPTPTPPTPTPPTPTPPTPTPMPPTPTPPAADACATSTTCGACTPRSGCGFCASTARCQSGNSAGPASADCPTGQWRWDPSECSGAPPPVYDAGTAPPPPPPPVYDAGTAPPPSGCLGTAPTTGFCTSPGSCAFQAPATTSCETRGAYDFYGAEFCAARATLIVVGAGWCGACQQEAPQLESQVTQPYRARGVRVISLLTENSDRSGATVDFGLRWQSRFGLTSRMVVNPDHSITRSVRLNAYPFVVVVDRRGRIRMAEAAPRITRIRSMLDAVLAEP